MKKLSQVPLGSNPNTAEAIGANNVQLNGTSQSDSFGIKPSDLKEFLQNKMIRMGNDKNKKAELMSELEQFISKASNEEIKKDLVKIGNALQMAGDKQSTDPETGLKDPDAIELSKRLLSKIEPLIKEGSKVYNYKLAQKAIEKKKKKTRGNPFRVLMGKVGKLLDHGVEKRDIVRYLAKLKYWNNETIERAVEIVMDYNRKKKKDSDKDEKSEKKASNESNIKTSALDYERKPDFKKRSTGELMIRACFLLDLLESDKFTKQGDFKNPADNKGAKEELKLIKEALVDRGVDKEDISNLGLGN